MRFPLPELPDNFDDGLREPSEMEMALEEQSNLLEQYETLLADLLRYYTVGHLAEWEYRSQLAESSPEASEVEEEFSGIADSHPVAEAGLSLQSACSELYAGLRGAEAGMSLTENMEPEQFSALLKEGDLQHTDQLVVDSRNQLDAAWSSFQGIAEDRVEVWLSEADSRLADID